MPGEPILIVDDNPQNLKLARVLLMREGYEVRTAEDGEEALRTLETFRPSLILMDLQLPGMDGLELTRRLKADPRRASIIILALTAYAMKGDEEKALAAGCDGYVVKPIDTSGLARTIAMYLARSPRTARTAWHTEEQTILVVEDNPVTRRMLRVALQAEGYGVVEAETASAAIEAAEHAMPSLVLQDLVLPDMNGFDLVRELRSLAGGDDVPIVALSGLLDRTDEARAAEAGFTGLFMKPIEPSRLVESVRAHLPRRSPRTATSAAHRLLIVDDDPVQLKLARIHHVQRGFQVVTAGSAEDALRVARANPPDVILSDILMPGLDGFQLCAEIRRDAKLRDVPVVLVSAHFQMEIDQDMARRVGANQLVVRTPDFEDVAAAVSRAVDTGARSPTDDPSIELTLEHARSVITQLERQVAVTSGLAQRCALQAAQLSLLSGVASALARNQDMHAALRDVLAAALDGTRISKGALLLRGPDDRLMLQHSIGFSTGERHALEGSFLQSAVLDRFIRAETWLVLPSPAVPDGITRALLEAAGARSMQVVPLLAAGGNAGALVLAAQQGDMTGEDSVAFARAIGSQIAQSLELADAFVRLVASEQRYRTLMESANDAISLLSPDGIIRETNRRWEEILGIPRDELIGRHVREVISVAGQSGDDDAFQRVLSRAGRTPPTAIRAASGEAVLIEFSNVGIEVGGEQRVLSIGREVTEQVRAQAQLLVSDRMASIGTLAAAVGHEINNPLTAVSANLDLAIDELTRLKERMPALVELEDLQTEIADAREAAERVRRIVRDLKVFSRSTDEETRRPVDVQQVLESTLRLVHNEIRHRARLVKDYGHVPPVLANEARLGQLFLNLLVNAAQAISEGQADENEICVRTFNDEALQRVVVEVRDTGEGMAPEIVGQAFTPFFTTKPVGVGTGLGLAICQRIVSGLGGEISVESERGRGTVFRVALPSTNPAPSETSPPAEPAAAARRARILIVDDEVVVGRTIQRMLAQEHDVEVASRAQDALERIAAGERFDLLLCDLMMPVMTGMDLHAELVRVAPDQVERMVFLTGGAFTPRAQSFLEGAHNGYLEKPFTREALRAIVNERLS